MAKKVAAALLGLVVLAMAGQPAFGDDSGTVVARVTVAAPCIQVSPTALDFGTLPFSTSTFPQTAFRDVTVTNCGDGPESLYARGTDAVSSAGTTWALNPAYFSSAFCQSPNSYGLGFGATPLSTQSVLIRQSFLARADLTERANFAMACSGSNGAGEVMTFSYIFTATLT